MRFRDLSIQRKLTFGILFTSGCALLVAGAAIVANDIVSLRNSMRRELSILADVLGNHSTAALVFGVRETAEDTLSALRSQPHIAQACLYDSKGRPFARYTRPGEKIRAPARPDTDGERFEDSHLVVYRPVILDNKRVGTMYLLSDLNEMNRRLRWYALVVVLVLLVALLVMFTLSLHLQRVISRPILALVGTAKIVSERQDYSVRAEKFSGDEMGLLTDALNQMLTQIQQRDAALQQARDELERRVEERTAELKKTNDSLQEEIAERKRAEEATALKARELERSNAELEQFAYVASHDLQEPLRMVASYVELLALRYRGRLDPDADEYIRFASNGAHRMQELIRDLLAYSRVGRRGKPFESTDCSAVCATALANLQVAIGESGAVITHDPLPTVMADATQLTQVFQNLIGNAIKFRGSEPPRIHLSARRQAAEWVFEIRDNGIGIDPKFSGRLFQIFQRLHGHDEYAGTGIGLALCKKIVERHGGRIGVESAPGRGSTFSFTIPIATDWGAEV